MRGHVDSTRLLPTNDTTSYRWALTHKYVQMCIHAWNVWKCFDRYTHRKLQNYIQQCNWKRRHADASCAYRWKTSTCGRRECPYLAQLGTAHHYIKFSNQRKKQRKNKQNQNWLFFKTYSIGDRGKCTINRHAKREARSWPPLSRRSACPSNAPIIKNNHANSLVIV